MIKKTHNFIRLYIHHLKKNLLLAIPIFFTQLGIIIIGISDNIIIGFFGKKALASISLANSIFFIFIIFGFGISSGVSSLIASSDAKNDYEDGAKIFYHGLIINFILSIIMYVFIHFFILLILPYLGQPKEILEPTISFLKIIALSFIPWMIFEMFRKFSEGLSISSPILISTCISTFINIILNFSFINGYYFIPKLGFLGVGYSTVISRVIMSINIFLILTQHKKTKNYFHTYKYFDVEKKYLKKIFKIGIPSGIYMLLEMSAFSISSFISGKCGIKELAAHQIVISLVSSTFILNTCFSIPGTVRVGNQLALKNYYDLRIIGWSVIFMGTIFLSICSILFILLRDDIALWYIKNDKEVALIVHNIMIIASIVQLFDGIQSIFMGILRGLQDVYIPLYISLFAYWILALPIGYILSIKLKIGVIGVWIGLGIGVIVSSILLMIRFINLTKKLLNTINNH
ncbi:MATE family efflux transporter [Blattabacterium cuenoti]|uniref:MATE family efflux transporter n=1 Tax=Blattabacterium cuenoti TaxID=1653831 RepID=UPI00293BEC6D|nr:MATE family efflux transporter [Blattabacterium cuenoti]